MKNSVKTEGKKSPGPLLPDAEEPGLSSLSENSLGAVEIHDDVIVSLAKNAALCVDGVLRLAGNSLVSSLADLVGSRRVSARAISVTVGAENQISLSLKVILLAGCRIPEVAENIQKAVISAVENATGMKVAAVQVLVQDIEEAPAASGAEKTDVQP